MKGSGAVSEEQRRWTRWLAVPFVLLCSALGAASAGAAEAPSLFWQLPRAVDHQTPFAAPLDFDRLLVRVACPSSSACIAFGRDRHLIKSTDPLGGPSAWPATSLPAGTAPIRDASCPSRSFCVAIDDGGDLYLSRDPFAGRPEWKTVAVDGNLAAVSCPTASLCVATDARGGVLASSTPADMESWHRTQVEALSELPQWPWLSAVACPSRQLCVAIDSRSGIFTSTDPLAGRWTRVQLPGQGSPGTPEPQIAGPTSVSCPTERLCVVVSQGTIFASADPAAGAASWTILRPATAVTAVGCVPGTSLCAASTEGGMLESANPGLGPGSWSYSAAPESTAASALACPSPNLCVAVGATGRLTASAAPWSGAPAWTVTPVDGLMVPGNVACFSTRLCALVDSAGNVLSSGDPVSTTTRWHRAVLDPGQPIEALACPGAALCLALDAQHVFLSHDPAATAPRWTASTPDPGHALTWLACATTSLCFAVDDAGAVLSTTRSGDPAAAWSRTVIEPGHRLDAIACAGARLCVAADDAGNVLSSTSPAAGPWTVRAIGLTIPSHYSPPPPADVSYLSCLASGTNGSPFCAGRTDGGELIESSEPTGGADAWRGGYPGSGSECGFGYCATQDPEGRFTSASASTACAPSWFCLTVTPYGTVSVGISAGLLKSMLRPQLVPRPAPRIGRLLRFATARISFAPPLEGTAVVEWRHAVRGGRALLVARGNAALELGSRAAVTIRLTRAGRRLLAGSRRVALTQRTTLTPAGAGPLVISQTLALRR